MPSITRVLLIVDASTATADRRGSAVEDFLASLSDSGGDAGSEGTGEGPARSGFALQIITFGAQAEWLVREPTPVEKVHWKSPRHDPGGAVGAALALAASIFDGLDERIPLAVVAIMAGPSTGDFAVGLASFDAAARRRSMLRVAVTIDAADRTDAERFAGVSGVIHEAGHAESGLEAALKAIAQDIRALGSTNAAVGEDGAHERCVGDDLDSGEEWECGDQGDSVLGSCLDEGLALEDADLVEEDLDLAGPAADVSSAVPPPSPEPPAPPGAGLASAAEKLDEVQFTVYRPRAVRPGEWTPLLAFVHLAERRPDAPSNAPDPIELVHQQAQAVLGASAAQFRDTSVDARQGIPKESEITLLPEIPGVTFNPPSRTFRWVKDVHREEFDMKADASLDGTTARGSIHAYLGVILIARIDLAVTVTSAVREEAHVAKDVVHAAPYRRIFASYSRRDAEVVRQFEQFIETTGDRFLQDVRQLRAGEEWHDGLLRLIDKADVFQLFWSSQSMRSPHVRREWEYALGLGRKNFIRPTFWEDPFPESPGDALPPDSLRRLHFHRLSARIAEQPPASDGASLLEASDAAVSGIDLGSLDDGLSLEDRDCQLAGEDFNVDNDAEGFLSAASEDVSATDRTDSGASGRGSPALDEPSRRPRRSSPLQSAPLIAFVVCLVVTAVLLGGLLLWQSL
ncbi:MAG: toll/interleukin-1 receptor domain-containing protein [Planctomycetia bacterium]